MTTSTTTIFVWAFRNSRCSPREGLTHPPSNLTLFDEAMNKTILRVLIEMGFIVFLFYANLLMGEFERSGMAAERGLAWALRDIVTSANAAIAVGAALIGYAIVEFLRNRL
jgi:hypothetical protein